MTDIAYAATVRRIVRPQWRARPARALIAVIFLITACSDITRVVEPGLLQPAAFQNPSGAASLRVAAVGQFESNFGLQEVYTDLLADEFTVASASQASGFPEDQLALTPASPEEYPFTQLSGTRVNALIAMGALKAYAPTPAWHVAELYALTAAIEIMFSENLCNGVSLAAVSNFTSSYGPTYTRNQLLAQALTDLDSAAAYATASDSILALAAVLRGRALVDSGQYAAAAAAVSAVPLTFAYTAAYDSATSINQIYSDIAQSQTFTVSDREGINGLPFVSGADPRVPTVAISTASGTTIYAPANDNTPTAPITLASGIEAQLIGAEAALAAGNATTWASTLNALRTMAISPAMPPLTADSTTLASPALQLAVMFRERAFWLFATGHRQGDLRRLVRQYGLPEASVFPTGLYLGGPEAYGTRVVFYASGDNANPNYHGCIDTNP